MGPAAPAATAGRLPPTPRPACARGAPALRRATAPRRGGRGKRATSALLLKSDPEEALRPDEKNNHHQRQGYCALEERALRQREDGDRLDVADHQRPNDAALDAAEPSQHHRGEHGDEWR